MNVNIFNVSIFKSSSIGDTIFTVRRVWRYQRGNQNPSIEEEQTTQWPKERVKQDKQSTKHTYKTKDRVTWTPLKTRSELRCSGRVSSSCSTSDTHRVNLVKNLVISHEWGEDREVLTTSGTYQWSFVTQKIHITDHGQVTGNFITCRCEWSAPFFVIYKAGHEPTPYWW